MRSRHQYPTLRSFLVFFDRSAYLGPTDPDPFGALSHLSGADFAFRPPHSRSELFTVILGIYQHSQHSELLANCRGQSPIGSVRFTLSAHSVGFGVPNRRQPTTLLTRNGSVFLSPIVLMPSVDLSFLIFEAPMFLIGLLTYYLILISRSMCTHLGNLPT